MNGQEKILCPLMKKIINKQGSNLYNLVLEVLSRVPDPQTSAEKKKEKERRPSTAHPDLGSALWTRRKFARDFRKDQQGLMKGEELTLLEQSTQLTRTLSHREKYTKSQPLSPTFLSGVRLFGHVSHSIELARRVWLTSTASIGSPIVST